MKKAEDSNRKPWLEVNSDAILALYVVKLVTIAHMQT